MYVCIYISSRALVVPSYFVLTYTFFAVGRIPFGGCVLWFLFHFHFGGYAISVDFICTCRWCHFCWFYPHFLFLHDLVWSHLALCWLFICYLRFCFLQNVCLVFPAVGNVMFIFFMYFYNIYREIDRYLQLLLVASCFISFQMCNPALCITSRS